MRNLQRLIQSEEFDKAYSKASEKEKAIAYDYIQQSDKKSLEKWIHMQLLESRELENLTVRDLRVLGQQLGVANYNFLPKASLLSEIRKKENESYIPEDRAVACRDAAAHVGGGSLGGEVQWNTGNDSQEHDNR